MFSVKKKSNQWSRYVDPTGELTTGELRAGEWYVRHKVLLARFGKAFLIFLAVVFWVYSLWGWAAYFFFGLTADTRMLERQTRELANYSALQSGYAAADIKISSVAVFESAPGRYDFVADMTNPNSRWLAHVRYQFLFQNGQTAEQESVLLPSANRPVVTFGTKLPDYPVGARLDIIGIIWQKISPHEVLDVRPYLATRLNFAVDKVVFVGSQEVGGAPVPSSRFELTNRSAYSYWSPTFYAELLQQGQRVGIQVFSLDRFRSGETRTVELRSFANNLAVTDIRIIPVIDVFDPAVFIAPGK
ncbi:MAG: hypothetical protein HY984_00215 [Candidatus Magasanikbacteria bacterium]|nr:hypothetical protein [Candidatus Magasanikbacteria bacterium]